MQVSSDLGVNTSKSDICVKFCACRRSLATTDSCHSLLLEEVVGPLWYWKSLIWRELLPWSWDTPSGFYVSFQSSILFAWSCICLHCKDWIYPVDFCSLPIKVIPCEMFSVWRSNMNIWTKVTAHSYSSHLLQAVDNLVILDIACSVVSYTRSEDSCLHNFNSLPSISFACSFSSEEIVHVNLQVLVTS